MWQLAALKEEGNTELSKLISENNDLKLRYESIRDSQSSSDQSHALEAQVYIFFEYICIYLYVFVYDINILCV